MKARIFLPIVAVLGLVAVWVASRPRSAVPGSPNVIVIVVDALRPDHVAAYGYHRALSPAIDRFAAEGTLFRTAVSQATWTLPSVSSLFLSQYVDTHGIEKIDGRIPEGAETLAEVLQAHGYATGAFAIGAYTSRDFGMDQGFDFFVSEGANAESRTAAMQKWIAAQAQPFFIYAHFVDVHYPYQAQNPYRENYGAEYRGRVDGVQPFGSIAATLGREDVQHLIDLYDNGVAYADFHLGRFFAWLRTASLDQHTVVLITADHGEAFQEHARMLGHRGMPYDELIRVPLLMRGPGIAAGQAIDMPVEHIDLAPTILDLCGIEPGPAMQGHSLRPVLAGGTAPERYVFSEYLPGEIKAIRSREWKLIADYKTGQHQLFDLRADAAEQHNLAAERPKVVQQLLAELASFSAANLAVKLGEPGPAAEIGAKTREQLRALGYGEN